MKTKSIITILLILISIQVYSQDNNQKIKFYNAWIELKNPDRKATGTLFQLKDSSIVISSSVRLDDYRFKNYTTYEFEISDISKIKVRRKSRIIKGALIGWATGFVAGGIYGYLQGDDPTYEVNEDPNTVGEAILSLVALSGNATARSAGQKAIGNALLFSIPGAVLGAVLGSMKVKIPIKSDIPTYQQNKDRLKKYTINK